MKYLLLSLMMLISGQAYSMFNPFNSLKRYSASFAGLAQTRFSSPLMVKRNFFELTLFRENTPEKKDAEAFTTTGNGIERKLTDNMEVFIQNTLQSLRTAQQCAKTPTEKYVASLAYYSVATNVDCGLLNKELYGIDPKVEQFAFKGFSYRQCKSLAKYSNPRTVKELTEQITNCPECMGDMMKFAQRLDSARKE